MNAPDLTVYHDGSCPVWSLELTEGQAYDERSADDMLATVREGTILLADRDYDSDKRQ